MRSRDSLSLSLSLSESRVRVSRQIFRDFREEGDWNDKTAGILTRALKMAFPATDKLVIFPGNLDSFAHRRAARMVFRLAEYGESRRIPRDPSEEGN